MTPEEIAVAECNGADYLPELEIVELPEGQLSVRICLYDEKCVLLVPAKYDLREQGNLPAVRDRIRGGLADICLLGINGIFACEDKGLQMQRA